MINRISPIEGIRGTGEGSGPLSYSLSKRSILC